MRSRWLAVSWLGLAMGMVCPSLDRQAAWATGKERSATPDTVRSSRGPVALSAQLPFAELPAAVREDVRKVVEQPTLTSRGPHEEFRGQPVLYHWLLDHPDRAAAAWRKLGYPCAEITDRGDGRFGWSDKAGSDLHWDAVYSNAHMHIWYAEGAVRPGPLMPLVPVRAVVVLHHGESSDSSGRPWLHHQAELFMHTDSKTAAAIAKLLGPAAPKAAEQCVTQLEVFFSALVRIMEHRPAKETVTAPRPATPHQK